SSDARVCIDSTTPTAIPEMAMSGAERNPSSKIWRIVSRASNGGTKVWRAARRANSDASPNVARNATTADWTRSGIRLPSQQGPRLLHRRGSPRGVLAAVLDLVFLHLAVERRTIEPEDLRRFLLVPVGPLQG